MLSSNPLFLRWSQFSLISIKKTHINFHTHCPHSSQTLHTHKSILFISCCCLNSISRQFNLVNLFRVEKRIVFIHFLSHLHVCTARVYVLFWKVENLLIVNFEICVTCFLFLSFLMLITRRTMTIPKHLQLHQILMSSVVPWLILRNPSFCIYIPTKVEAAIE